MNFTLAPESFRELRIFCPARPGSITAASRLESSTTRYALFFRGGAVNVVTRIAPWIRGRVINLPSRQSHCLIRMVFPRPWHALSGETEDGPEAPCRGAREDCQGSSADAMGVPSDRCGGGGAPCVSRPPPPPPARGARPGGPPR